MRYTTVLFDLDGTLLDTLEDLTDSVNYAMNTMGWPLRPKEQVRLFLGNGIRNLMKLCSPKEISDDEYEKAFNIFKKYYDIHSQDKTKPYEGVVELMSRFSDKGIKMAIVSNKIDSAVLKLRDRFFPYVQIAIGDRPDIRRKPEPDSCNLALELLGSTREETVYVGDSEVDLLTAKNAGLPCISVLWGFRDEEYLVQEGAKVFARTPEDVEKEVLG